MAPQGGALQLESSELRFETSADGRSQDVIRKQELAVMANVAEAMIAANCAVARRIQEAFPQAALLRRHAPPRPEAFAEVGICRFLRRTTTIILCFAVAVLRNPVASAAAADAVAGGIVVTADVD